MNADSLSRLALACALAIAAVSSPAADSAPATPAAAASDRLTAARSLIAQQKWAAAIDELQRVNATGSADWHNLMGYSHRKARTPDYAAAERHYDEALRIDPGHRGALEYSGELYLMLGDGTRAEARLATLDKVCATRCEEQAELKKAIERYKANGNRYAQSP